MSDNLTSKTLMPDVVVLFAGVPREYREELLTGLKQYFANPDIVFNSVSESVTSSYKEIIQQCEELSPVEKQNFVYDLDRFGEYLKKQKENTQ